MDNEIINEWSEEYHKNREKYGERLPEMKYSGNKKVNKLGNRSWQKYIQSPFLFKEISNLNIPSLFIFGSKDVRPSWPAEQISNLISNSSFKMIEGAGHYIWLTHPEKIKEELRKFVMNFSI